MGGDQGSPQTGSGMMSAWDQSGAQSSWADYQKVLDQQKRYDEMSAAIGKGIQQFGSAVASGSKYSGSQVSVPQQSSAPISQGGSQQYGAPIPTPPMPQQQTDVMAILRRILGGQI